MRQGRRWLVAAVVVAGGVGVAWAATGSGHGDPDPGGRVLAALVRVDQAIPADAQVMVRQAHEPQWDSCDGRAGTFGWTGVMVIVQFGTDEPASELISQADRILRAEGWQRTGTSTTPLGPTATWSRVVAGSTAATASLSPWTRGQGSPIYWDLDAMAPPHGQRVSGC